MFTNSWKYNNKELFNDLNNEFKSEKSIKLGFGLSEIESISFETPPLNDDELEREKFCEQVYFTLHSLVQGYTDIQTLKKDILYFYYLFFNFDF